MLIAIVGCLHGELDNVYENIKTTEEKEGIKIDLLICCGDFQSTRNIEDLRCMAVPLKYQDMCSFYKYYSGEKQAPVLTIFIGGNHEASNYLQELPYGGWVAPNVFYLGYAGVISYGGLRIGGISGIYKGADYMKGHFEKPPYSESTKRSVYHVRNLEVFRMKQLSSSLDVMISHDWPRGIWEYGNKEQLLRHKPFFRDDIEQGQLGSEACKELLHHLKPSYWLAAHLHTKFVALVPHISEKEKECEEEPQPIKSTRFLALDKCLKKKRYLQLLEVPNDESKPKVLEYDLEWLTILFLTNHLLSVEKGFQYMPGPCKTERWIYTPSKEEMDLVLKKFNNDLKIPNNFVKTVAAYSGKNQNSTPQKSSPPIAMNPQTSLLCSKLSIDDPLALLIGFDSSSVSPTTFDSLSMSQTTFDSSYSFIDTSTPFTDVSTPFKDVSTPCTEISTPVSCSPSLSVLSLPKPKFDDSQTSLPENSFPELFDNLNTDGSENAITDHSLSIIDSQELVSDSQEDASFSRERSPNSKSESQNLPEVLISKSEVPVCKSPDEESEVPTCESSKEESEPISALPMKKKFKRRNHSLYVTESEETPS